MAKLKVANPLTEGAPKAAARVSEGPPRPAVRKVAERAQNLGDFLRDQRRGAQLTLRQLADQTGVSNPYLSQIERGLRKPSADVLQQLAKALRISAESLYVRAGILEPDRGDEPGGAERPCWPIPQLSERQRQVLLDIYNSFRRESARRRAADPIPRTTPRPPTPPPRRRHLMTFTRPRADDREDPQGPREDARPTPTPLYVIAGAGDFAVEKLRTVGADINCQGASSRPEGVGRGQAATSTRRCRPPRSRSRSFPRRSRPSSVSAVATALAAYGDFAAARRGPGRPDPQAAGDRGPRGPGSHHGEPRQGHRDDGEEVRRPTARPPRRRRRRPRRRRRSPPPRRRPRPRRRRPAPRSRLRLPRRQSRTPLTRPVPLTSPATSPAAESPRRRHRRDSPAEPWRAGLSDVGAGYPGPC